MTARSVMERVVAWSARHALLAALLALLAGAAGLFAVHARLGVTTDTDGLFARSLPWKQRQEVLKAAFPQNEDLIVAVIDARLPEEAEATAAALTQRLRADHAHFTTVRQPDASPYLERNALLFLDPPALARLLDTTIDAEPFIGTLAADPSLRGLDTALGLIAEGATQGGVDLAPYRAALARFETALHAAAAGHPTPLSWERLLAGPLVDLGSRFHFVLAKPVLDYGALEPGLGATEALRAVARTLPDVAQGSADVRVTGPVVLDDEEFASVAKGAVGGLLGSLVLVAVWLFLAVRSWRVIVPILLVLVLGLDLTSAFAALAVGTLNLVSVAFAILFVGIAVDFAIQFSVRFRAEAVHAASRQAALATTGRRTGTQILVAAAATAAGFLAFTPTSFNGVAELGLIAGIGMLIAFACTLAVLPALLVLFRATGGTHEVGYRRLAPADRFLATRRRPVLAGFGLLAAAALAALPRLAFDSDPLHTKNPNTEAMHTLAALADDPHTNPYTMEMLLPSLAQAQALARRLDRLPLVDSTVTAASFVPDQQPEKRALIADAAAVLLPALTRPDAAAPPDAAALRRSLATLAKTLGAAATARPHDPIFAALAHDVATLATLDDRDLRRTDQALTAFLPTQLARLRRSLQAAPVTLADLPPDIARDWLTPDGRAHLEIAPRRSAEGSAGLHRFVAEVRSVAPDASGSAVTIVASADTITSSFRTAACAAVLAITLILTATLRRLRDLLLVLAPLLLSALLTALFSVLLGLDFNFANIIALPLLLGVGVSFNIYFVMNWRAGENHPLASASARAILFSALTTGTAFGSLALSAHPGTASMGRLLLLSLACTLIATLAFLPALLAASRRT